MDEEDPGPGPGDTAASEDPGLAERLIREEFAGAAPTHRVRGHVDDGEDVGADDTLIAPAALDTAEVPVVEAEGPITAAVPMGASRIHEEFARPARKARFRSHRAGMLAGLGVVGALLAVLVLLAPGGGTPKLPSQSVHDVSPISASGPKTAAATAPTTAAPSTTASSTTPTTTPTATPPSQSETVSTYITYSYVPGTPAPAATPTTSAPTATTAPPTPTTTTTTSPPAPTTTPTSQCLLGLIC